jgi:Fur family transcriptional regulator, ferric uptake regulator
LTRGQIIGIIINKSAVRDALVAPTGRDAATAVRETMMSPKTQDNSGVEMVRMTRQREIILDEVRRAICHPTADEVFTRVRRRLPRVSLGTVYRNLDILAQMCMIRKISCCDAPMRFDGCLEDHCHLHCIHCGCLADAPLDSDEVMRLASERLGGAEIIGCRVELLFVCPRCRAAHDAKKAAKAAGDSRRKAARS